MQSMSNLTWPVFLIASGSHNSVGLKIKETVKYQSQTRVVNFSWKQNILYR